MPGKVVCLLPVRNGEVDLPDYLESAAHWADAVVALDDGSTDGTRTLLDAHPLVKLLLTNPIRESYEDWDDADNRNRLLEAASVLEPEWVLFLDADERIPADDAAALRSFLESDALPMFAYGFQVFRMCSDLEHFDGNGLWVYRLFAYGTGQRLPEQRLHFVPVPTDIPRHRWLRTTIRIQHLGGLTEKRRQARFQKYREADPDNAYQNSYKNLLEAPTAVEVWTPRPPGSPVLDVDANLAAVVREDAEHVALSEISDRPALSAIIISRDDGERILRSVGSVVNQTCPWPFEVIVVASGTGGAAQLVRERFPAVTVCEVTHPALPGEARNIGLRVARGEYVTFPGSHIELPPGSLASRLRAHDRGYAMVTCTTLNGTRTWAGWASYFLDHAGVLPGRPSSELEGAPSHCSYRRTALLSVGGFPEQMRAGEDTVVNNELARRGYLAFRAQDVAMIHHSRCRVPRILLRHHFERGRGFGTMLRENNGVHGRMLFTKLGLRLLRRQVGTRVASTTRNVLSWSGNTRLITVYWWSFPLVVAGAIAACAGTWYEILRPGATSTARPEEFRL